MTDATSSAQKGWFDVVYEKLSVDKIVKKLDLSRDKLITMALYLGAGLLIGFLAKRFFKYVVILAAIVIGVILLEKSGLVHFSIDWNKANEIFGIKSVPQVDGNMFWGWWLWIKANVAVSVSFLLGFIIGWKVG